MKIKYRIYNIYLNEIKNRIDTLINHFFPCSHLARGMTKFIADVDNKNLVGVEIGVHLGDNANIMLSILSIVKLYLVDPYTPYIDEYSHSGINHCYIPYNNDTIRQKEASEKLKHFGKKCVFISMTSEDAIKHIPSNLDFVYIDGNHSYNYVKHDLELYYPKVKKGGVIGGHDFSHNFIGVIKAVLEFIESNNLNFYLDISGDSTDWWIVKK